MKAIKKGIVALGVAAGLLAGGTTYFVNPTAAAVQQVQPMTINQAVNCLKDIYPGYIVKYDHTTQNGAYVIQVFQIVEAGNGTTMTQTLDWFTVNPKTHEADAMFDPNLSVGLSYKQGWAELNGKWYYYNPSTCQKVTGWLPYGGKWYFMDSSGAMKTGWVSTGGKWYYLDATGAMKTGWILYGGKWYYLETSGAMKTGWILYGGKWYYLETSGAMKTGWILYGGKWDFLTASGAMKTGWLQLGKTKYYLDSSGAMVIGWQSIGGRKYYFNSNGSWIK